MSDDEVEFLSFWIVVSAHASLAGRPIRHRSLSEAMTAASRLARHYPGDRFDVFVFTGISMENEVKS